MGLGEEGWKPAGDAAEERNDPSAGCCLVERSARSSSRRKAATRGPSSALKRPVCLTSRQPLLALRRQRRATLQSEPSASLRQGPQPPEAAPGDQLAGPPPHPQDRRNLKRPAVSGGAPGRRPCPCPGCRPQPPGRRTAASPGPSTRRRSTEPPRSPPLPWSTPAKTASAPSTSPACLSRRASWTLLATLGVSVAGAVSGCSENSAAMSRSISSSRLRRGFSTVAIVRLPVANVAVVITTSLYLGFGLRPCGQRRRAVPGWRRPLRVGMGMREQAAPLVSV